MRRKNTFGLLYSVILIAAIFGPAEASEAQKIISPEGYSWPSNTRDYWPTNDWRVDRPEAHGVDIAKLQRAEDLARADSQMRALLVIKNGKLVYENYFHGGARDRSDEVWSVTKAVTSAAIGVAIYEQRIGSTDDLMRSYLPQYSDFGTITIEDVLTHKTGLAWEEEGASFVNWLLADDPVADALSREKQSQRGAQFLYSSGNTHFLSALINEVSGESLGEYVDERLFDPIGIVFDRQTDPERITSWEQFLPAAPQTWKQDAMGREFGPFGLNLTAREMAKFGFLLLNCGWWDGAQLMPAEWVELSAIDHARRRENWGFGYGLVVSKRAGQLTFNADGWGGQIISIIPSLDMIVVIKSDSENPRGHPYYEILTAATEAGVE